LREDTANSRMFGNSWQWDTASNLRFPVNLEGGTVTIG
jgi:hypothetical protein